MKKILIAVDGSEDSDKAIEKGAELAKGCGWGVVLLAVPRRLAEIETYLPGISVSYLLKKTERADKEGLGSRLEELDDKLANIGRQFLEDSKKSMEANGVKNVKTVVKYGKPAEQILKAAEEEGADLIIVGCRGKHLSKTLLGSVSREISERSKISVMIAR